MLSRAEILRKIFKEGLKNVDKKTLQNIFKTTRSGIDIPVRESKLWRLDPNPLKLMEEGFKPQGRPFTQIVEKWLLKGGYTPAQIDEWTVKGLPQTIERKVERYYGLGEAGRAGESAYDEPGLYWSKRKVGISRLVPEQRKGQLRLKSSLVEGVVNPDVTISNINVQPRDDVDFLRRGALEIIQKKPGSVLAKYNDLYRILAILGLLGAPEELEQRVK